jgi:hypothetical protein
MKIVDIAIFAAVTINCCSIAFAQFKGVEPIGHGVEIGPTYQPPPPPPALYDPGAYALAPPPPPPAAEQVEPLCKWHYEYKNVPDYSTNPAQLRTEKTMVCDP